MTFRFKRSDATVEAAIRRIAAELVGNVREGLTSDSLPFDVAIHDARKAVKKLRAVVRLVKQHCTFAHHELAHLRNAAAFVAPLRDAVTQLATFDRISADLSLPEDDLARLRAPFVTTHVTAHDPRNLAAAISGYAQAMRAIGVRSRSWKVSRKGFAAISPGLSDTWDAARHALDDALAGIHPEAIHTLRKRIKDHGYHAHLLEPVAPSLCGPHIIQTTDLGELLGDINDLDILLAALPDDAYAMPLRKAVTDRRARLAALALPKARDFLAPSSDAVADAWRAAWKRWRR